MDTLHSAMTERTWKDSGKLKINIANLLSKIPTGFGNVDTGVTIWATEDIILGLWCVILTDSSITRILVLCMSLIWYDFVNWLQEIDYEDNIR